MYNLKLKETYCFKVSTTKMFFFLNIMGLNFKLIEQ